MKPQPYGSTYSDGRYEKWLEDFGMTYRPRGRCVHWLQKGRCGSWCQRLGSWMDHTSGYTNSHGHRVLICQPYGLGEEDLVAIAKAAQEFDLDVTVVGHGWYGRATVCIELRRNEDVRAESRTYKKQLASPAEIMDELLNDACEE